MYNKGGVRKKAPTTSEKSDLSPVRQGYSFFPDKVYIIQLMRHSNI